MKIKKLTIKNIASIENAELDFEHGPLGEAPLFLICGETGSGKTTILDAITLALYGKTPRYAGGNRRMDRLIGGMAYNDSRQLVRRGSTSASATVELVGNDGREYTACWSVDAVTRGDNRGQLKPEVWRWKDRSPNGLEYTQDRTIREVVERAVGLGFEQFCRTTMLAQGQFTKFLLGTDDEKAEILEKLTNTERFKQIGIAIYRKHGALEGSIRDLKKEIAGKAGLGAERPTVEAGIAEQTAKIAAAATKHQSATARLQWLRRRDELALNARGVRGELERSFASLKVMEGEVAAKLRSADEKLAALRKYLGDHADQAGMYEAAGVILENLDDVRAAREAKAQAEAESAKCQSELPGLVKGVEDAGAGLEKASGEVEAAETEVAAEEAALEALDRKGVLQRKGEDEKLRGDLQGLAGKIDGIAVLKTNVANREAAVAERRDALARKEAELPGLKDAMDAAREKSAQARKARDDQKKLIDDGIEKLVADLNVGDVCPVCGNRIEQLHARGHFKELFRALDAACAEAEAASDEEGRRYNHAAAAVEEFKKTIDSETKSIDEAKAKIAQELAAAAEAARSLGVADGSAASVANAVAACEQRIAELNVKLEEIDRQDRKVRELKVRLRTLEKVRNDAQSRREQAERMLAATRSRLELQQAAVQREGDRERRKLADVAGKVSAPAWLEAWERNPAAVEREFRSAAAEYVARRADLPKMEGDRKLLAETGERVAECIRRAVAKVDALAAVESGGIAAESTAAVEGLLGRFEEAEGAMARHAEARPEDLQETDAKEALAEACAALKNEMEASIEKRGKFQQQIAYDDQCADERAEKERELEEVQSSYNEWDPIYNRYGDQNGKKIQREVQSYVLANVLVKANYYLGQLSDRYRLSCEGLMLSVVDAHEGGTVRPVNTLSGGEQFLVSLALALGLAGMSDTGLSVDMLLIDEGFGTLSGTHLNSAIEALERLNTLTGSRKVGVISHVERLRERIRTHVEVTRNGHDPSTVRVVG